MDAYVLGQILFAVFAVAFSGLFLFFYLKNLSDLLKVIRLPNRRMSPGQVWLLLISLVNVALTFSLVLLNKLEYIGHWAFKVTSVAISLFVILWQFRMVYRIADSIEAEYDSRGISIEHRPTFQTGMFMAAARAASLLTAVPDIAFVGYLANLAYVCGVIAYWVRTYKFRKELQAMGAYVEDKESTIFKDL